MSRPVKGDHEQLACWIPARTMQRLDASVTLTKMSKREILTAALDEFFDKLEQLERPATKEKVA